MAEFKKPPPRRTFADALHKKGEAANIREVVSKAVRENAIQVRECCYIFGATKY